MQANNPFGIISVTYRLLQAVSGLVARADTPDFYVKLINTGLAEQFVIHMKTAICAGFICASPYALYQLFRFVSPALYANERRYVVQESGCVYALARRSAHVDII